ncbi:candidate tolA protein [Ramlibacter tataouinensis TTB310]|uniref:Candidate tolA protein n=1 Tax=Ramlibacter tataouinensis (strain ATCC BAA-407 / DSM 14655 / LMG 21543 / TTB310) TaxID=365046 RepID=F5Y4U9_RAMTT|nr:candidate tolA protein [Ramlibacter tataouinensis TTB310]
MVLAVVVHALLLIALTWGVQWKRDSQNVVAEAELWSAVPQQAAPRETAPPPAPPPVAQKPPAPPPPPPAPQRREADIAQEREKQRQAQEKQRELEEQQQRERERQKRLEAQKQAEAQKRLAEQKRQEELKQKQAQAEKEAERRKQDQAAAAKAKAREAELAELRQENLKRLQGLAGTGGPSASGTAARSSGPSAGYASRIAASIKRNIVFTDVVSGNPATEVRIRVAPDGTIVGKTLVRSSGNKAWDEAVLRAIDRTGSIPRDTDGSVVPEFPALFRPND